MDRRVGKKTWNTHMWDYSAETEEATMCGNREGLEGMRLPGISQAEKDRHGIISLVYGI